MNDIEILEELIQIYKDCGLDDYPEMVVDFSLNKHEIFAIKNLIQRNKELEQIEKEYKEENERLKDRIKVLEEIDLTTVYIDGFYDGRNRYKEIINKHRKKENK